MSTPIIGEHRIAGPANTHNPPARTPSPDRQSVLALVGIITETSHLSRGHAIRAGHTYSKTTP